MRRRTRILLALTTTAFALAVIGAGEVLSHPYRSAEGALGDLPPDLPARAMETHTRAGDGVSGWMVPGQQGRGAVLLLHGVRADRRQMLGRARFLHRLGYSVLLVDLPAHGASAGKHITYGLAEAEGARAALAYLAQELPAEKVGVIGVSLGAAALVLARPEVAPAAVVLESMFPTIEEAVADRLKRYLGPLGGILSPLLLWQLPLRLGITPDQLRPIEAIAHLRSPVLITSGSADPLTTLTETRRIHAAAPAPEDLWVVDGAAHVDLYGFDPVAYEAKVSAFLARHLRAGG